VGSAVEHPEVTPPRLEWNGRAAGGRAFAGGVLHQTARHHMDRLESGSACYDSAAEMTAKSVHGNTLSGINASFFLVKTP
jgi:hypothetical protein